MVLVFYKKHSKFDVQIIINLVFLKNQKFILETIPVQRRIKFILKYQNGMNEKNFL
jgi:hypothetical protein